MSDAIQPIRQLLSATLSSAQALRSLLDQEREQLAGGRTDMLQELLERKLELLQQLEQQELQRQQLLQQAGREPGKAAMAELAAADAELGRLWPALLEELHALQVLNEANGGVIRKQMGRIEQSLSVLTGRNRGDLYDTHGSRSGGERGREIDRA